ncbi:porin family protein [Constantimarinum furrinae]|nr:hypothetical protein [Constantimarinum furrinae]
MKSKVLFLLAGFFFFSLADVNAQRKTDEEVRAEAMAKSVKNFNTVLTRLYGNARLNPKPKSSCSKEAVTFLKNIDKKSLVPDNETLEKEITRILDSLEPKLPNFKYYTQIRIFKAFVESKSYADFVFNLTTKDIGELEQTAKGKLRLLELNAYYRKLKRMLKQPFTVFKKSFKKGKCVYKVETKLQLTQLKYMFKKNKDALTANWDITSKIVIDCPCVTADSKRFRNAVFVYSSKSVGPIYTRRVGKKSEYTHWYLVAPYGLVIGAMEKPKLVAQQILCCTEKSGLPPENSNYIEIPDKDINYRDTWVDGSLGISFGKDELTLGTASGGVFFNVGNISGNPVHIGGKLSAVTPLGEKDIKETRITVGLGAEYHIPLGNNRLNILTGVQGGYTFGSVEAFGFKDNISGFSGMVYTGVEIPLNNNIALGVLLNVFEYSNLTFKAENNEFESTVSNSIFIFDRPSISANLRINLK